ncbi:unnamed protein product [Dibothriocephalus latus]|uniref:Uncharacterized protein n=1 Tax=Dibothriocephalus latus TaxID=60516 RepID=A0A3P7NAQ3_DIBLA|nr:unnamed protein product [Dibothriocephalus latus]
MRKVHVVAVLSKLKMLDADSLEQRSGTFFELENQQSHLRAAVNDISAEVSLGASEEEEEEDEGERAEVAAVWSPAARSQGSRHAPGPWDDDDDDDVIHHAYPDFTSPSGGGGGDACHAREALSSSPDFLSTSPANQPTPECLSHSG